MFQKNYIIKANDFIDLKGNRIVTKDSEYRIVDDNDVIICDDNELRSIKGYESVFKLVAIHTLTGGYINLDINKIVEH